MNSCARNMHSVEIMGFSTKPNYKPRSKILCRANTLSMKNGRKNDFYKVLSLDLPDVGLDEIKKAYRSMALQYHPDVCPAAAKEESTRRFIEVQMAYETLSDPISRRMYDYELNLESFSFQEKKSRYLKDVWEMQLWGLKERSHNRAERRRKQYC